MAASMQTAFKLGVPCKSILWVPVLASLYLLDSMCKLDGMRAATIANYMTEVIYRKVKLLVISVGHVCPCNCVINPTNLRY